MISGRLAALSLALGVAAQPVAAQELAAGKLMRQLAAVESSHATFVETRHSALLKEPLVLRGTLTYRRPAFLEKRVEQPYVERMAIDGDALVVGLLHVLLQKCRTPIDERAAQHQRFLQQRAVPGLDEGGLHALGLGELPHELGRGKRLRRGGWRNGSEKKTKRGLPARNHRN